MTLDERDPRYVRCTRRFAPIFAGTSIALTLAAAPLAAQAGGDAPPNRASLAHDVAAGANIAAGLGLAAGILVAGTSDPEEMGLLAIVVLPMLTLPIGAVAGAMIHLLGHDVPGWNPFGIEA